MGGPSSSFGGTPYKSVFGDQFKLKIDPKLQAEMDALKYRMQIQQLRAGWFTPDWSQLDKLVYGPSLPPAPTGPLAPGKLQPPAAQPFCSYKPGAGPKAPRKGEASDVLKAVWALPCVQHAVGQAQSHAERQWGKLGTAEKVLVVGHSVLIGGGLVAGIASDDPSRVWILDKISGVSIPVPKLEGVSFRLHAPKGVLGGGGLSYQTKALDLSADVQQKALPTGTTYNDMNFSIKINVLEALPQLKKIF